jgi:hypothetical protein
MVLRTSLPKVSSKKRSTRKASRPSKPSQPAPKSRQGLSGNPQRRAEQLRERTGRELVGQIESFARPERPAPQSPSWWPESHASVIARVRDTEWPSRLFDVETVAGEIAGDELHARTEMPDIHALNATRWLETLADKVETALQEDIATESEDWPRLWAFLRGQYSEKVQPKLEATTKLLADHGLTPTPGFPLPEYRPTGDALVAQDAYGSRFLVVAPFGEIDTTTPNEPASSPNPGHWYAWDLDWCFAGTVVAASTWGSAAEALDEWRDAVGPAASTAELSGRPPVLTLRLLRPALVIGTLLEELLGGEPRELAREYFRLNHRALALAEYLKQQPSGQAWPEERSDDLPEAFVAWYAEHVGAWPMPADQAVEGVKILFNEWRSFLSADKEMSFGCSPHRIETTGGLIREGYESDDANAALRLLPEWTQWCLTHRPIDPEAAARSLEAARAQAALLVGDDHEPDSEEDRDPFIRRE